jgi:hypothetical protein
MFYLRRSDETPEEAIFSYGGVGLGHDTRQEAIRDLFSVWEEDCDFVEMGQWDNELTLWSVIQIWTASDLEEMRAGG